MNEQVSVDIRAKGNALSVVGLSIEKDIVLVLCVNACLGILNIDAHTVEKLSHKLQI